MNINFEDYLIPIITIGCMCIGYVMKKWLPTDDKWIPTVLLIVGAISGAILFGLDYAGIVKGALSGLASIGLHQVFYQFEKNRIIPINIDGMKYIDDEEIETEGVEEGE
ncbi:MAG: phage holin family protein [Acutalibacteraceae bacterium]|nr:phage holin family protein [Acutalibacteraceae bacterium]